MDLASCAGHNHNICKASPFSAACGSTAVTLIQNLSGFQLQSIDRSGRPGAAKTGVIGKLRKHMFLLKIIAGDVLH
jgi:hypothetical protein